MVEDRSDRALGERLGVSSAVVSDVEIAVLLSTEELARLDRAVAEGRFESRGDAVRQALHDALARLERSAEIEESYRRAYSEHPEDERIGEVGLQLLRERVAADRRME
jgi:Arc/MetJ-type ribon-helix-helix transcriptional regulator